MSIIVLTNDDCIHAPGLKALEDQLGELGELWVIAPHAEQSACGRSVTLHRPLRVERLGERRFAVDGTPSDCVLLGFRSLIAHPPAVVVSGINRGYNIGEDLDYSGTVAAAAEGALQGAQLSLAVSMDRGEAPAGLEWGAKVTVLLVRQLLDHLLPPFCYLNVNLPRQQTPRVRWTRQGNPLPSGEVIKGIDPRGVPYYWIAECPDEANPPPQTDRGALRDGCISLSVLTLDRCHQGSWTRPNLCSSGFREDQP